MSEVHTNVVLIADDDPSIRTVMRVALRKEGYEVLEAADGREAVAIFADRQPDMVLLDVEMPHLDGFAACEQMRTLPGGENVPIVIVTGRDDLDAVNQAYQASATDFIAKPINWPVFTHRVRYVLRANENYQKLGASELRNAALLSAIPDELLIVDRQGVILEYFPGSQSEQSDLGEPGRYRVSNLLSEEAAAECMEIIATVLKTGEMQSFEFAMFRRERWTHQEARLMRYLDDRVLVIVTEVTERKLAEQRIHRLAYFDPLTELPNRQYFMQHLGRMIESAQEQGSSVAVFYVDLDNFKRINDNLGHSYGDGVLKAVAERLSGCMRARYPSSPDPAEVFGIARLGGDEFAATVENVSDEKTLTSIAERIRRELREPVRFSGHEFVVTPSVGIALYPQDGESVDDLLKHADVALYQAKGAGRDSIRFYRDAMSLRSMHRLELENRLRRTIENGDLELYYQPKYELDSGRIVGAEALTRWRDEDGEYIPPTQFIPIAEESGLITPLGDWVLQAACRQIKDWRDRLDLELPVAVNISSHQLYHCDLLSNVMRSLFDASVRPSLLQLEITESILMRDVDDTIRTLKALKEAGLSLAIDDFGTGYSSLSYLKKFPLDALKIDRSFVMDLEGDDDDAVICQAIIAMASSLGLKVIAEGIETQMQLDFLRDNGCREGQGFFFSPPVPVPEFELLLKTGKHVRSRQSH